MNIIKKRDSSSKTRVYYWSTLMVRMLILCLREKIGDRGVFFFGLEGSHNPLEAISSLDTSIGIKLCFFVKEVSPSSGKEHYHGLMISSEEVTSRFTSSWKFTAESVSLGQKDPLFHDKLNYMLKSLGTETEYPKELYYYEQGRDSTEDFLNSLELSTEMEIEMLSLYGFSFDSNQNMHYGNSFPEMESLFNFISRFVHLNEWVYKNYTSLSMGSEQGTVSFLTKPGLLSKDLFTTFYKTVLARVLTQVIERKYVVRTHLFSLLGKAYLHYLTYLHQKRLLEITGLGACLDSIAAGLEEDNTIYLQIGNYVFDYFVLPVTFPHAQQKVTLPFIHVSGTKTYHFSSTESLQVPAFFTELEYGQLDGVLRFSSVFDQGDLHLATKILVGESTLIRPLYNMFIPQTSISLMLVAPMDWEARKSKVYSSSYEGGFLLNKAFRLQPFISSHEPHVVHIHSNSIYTLVNKLQRVSYTLNYTLLNYLRSNEDVLFREQKQLTGDESKSALDNLASRLYTKKPLSEFRESALSKLEQLMPDLTATEYSFLYNFALRFLSYLSKHRLTLVTNSEGKMQLVGSGAVDASLEDFQDTDSLEEGCFSAVRKTITIKFFHEELKTYARAKKVKDPSIRYKALLEITPSLFREYIHFVCSQLHNDYKDSCLQMNNLRDAYNSKKSVFDSAANELKTLWYLLNEVPSLYRNVRGEVIFYFPAFRDFRGRIYCSGNINYQSSTLVRSAVIFTNQSVLFSDVLGVFKVFMCRVYYRDSTKYQSDVTLVRQFDLQIQSWLSYLTNVELLSQMKEKVSDFYSWLCGLLEYSEYLRNPQYKTSMLFHVDACANSYQQLFTFLRNAEGASQVNISKSSRSSTPCDFYSSCMAEILVNHQSLDKYLTRSLMKKILMPFCYGATAYTIHKTVSSECPGISTSDRTILVNAVLSYLKTKYEDVFSLREKLARIARYDALRYNQMVDLRTYLNTTIGEGNKIVIPDGYQIVWELCDFRKMIKTNVRLGKTQLNVLQRASSDYNTLGFSNGYMTYYPRYMEEASSVKYKHYIRSAGTSVKQIRQYNVMHRSKYLNCTASANAVLANLAHLFDSVALQGFCYSKYPLFTIHDCIYSTGNHILDAKSSWLNSFRKAHSEYGLREFCKTNKDHSLFCREFLKEEETTLQFSYEKHGVAALKKEDYHSLLNKSSLSQLLQVKYGNLSLETITKSYYALM